MNITIDTKNRKIIFINIFLGIKNTYSFTDFDYYIETVEHSIGGSFKAIYLIKNRKLKKAIRGFYYSNIDVMENGIKDIPSRGFKSFNWLASLLLYLTRMP